MVNKNQVINGVIAFMENNMIPTAKDNYKIILRTVQAGMAISPDKIWNLIKDNEILAMTGAIEGDQVDIELLARILATGFGNDEFNFTFKVLGNEYKIYLTAEDIRTLKGYIERA